MSRQYVCAQYHCRPQSPRSFWPVVGIESSGFVQHRKSAIHGLPVKSGKFDWLRIWNEYSAHAQKIGSSQSSRSLPQVRKIVGSGDENGSVHSVVLRSVVFSFGFKVLVVWTILRKFLYSPTFSTAQRTCYYRCITGCHGDRYHGNRLKRLP